MTYAQVGTSDQVGTNSQVGPGSWEVAGVAPGTVVDAEFTHANLVLTVRVDESGKDYLRSVTASSGDTHRLPRNGGEFVTRDVSGTGIRVQVTPPGDQQPPLGPAVYLPEESDERSVEQQGQEYLYNIAFTREDPLPIDFSHTWSDETQGTGEWLLALHRGDVATNRLSHDIRKGSSGGIGDRSITAVLSASQAAVWAESLRYLDAQQDREIMDGDSFVADTSANSSNTVTVTPPSGGERYIPAGDYVVRGWTARRINAAYWRVQASLGEAG